MNSINNSKQLVSIGLPVYNGEIFIRQAIDSLLAQDYENFELIISDNDSHDRTQEICMEYAAQDKRVRYQRCKTNMGAFWNFNHVFELSTGEYFMWASHDDYWESSYISTCLKAYELSKNIILAGTFCEAFDPEGKKETFIDPGLTTIGFSPQERFKKYKTAIHAGRHIGGIFYGVYKYSFLSTVLPLKKIVANDHLVLAELCLQGEFNTVKEKLVYKRYGGASTSHRNNARAQGINNELLIQFPYFVREILLQRIIFRTSNLLLSEKIKLSFWSLWNYSYVTCKLSAYRVLAFLKPWLKKIYFIRFNR
ncbi:MAG: glycosyltransferase family 2 protein [Desulfobacteraceae bacterium]|nr:glycosyltransferase family 2 protein [Desulfobacteraceae bacterium]